MKWFPQGQWSTERGIAECVEQEGFGIIGAWIDATGEGVERAALICAAPELLAACKLAQRHFDDIGPVIGESDEAHAERMLRHALQDAIAKVR